MSSTSSICSSNDADFIVDTRIPASIRRDIDRFSVFVNRLRAVLDLNSSIVDGDSMCVNVHAALEMVSESMRDLFKYPQFKTNPIILLSLQLVQAVKDLKFDTCSVDTTPVLNIIDQLESAVLNIILNRHIVSSVHTPSRSSTLGRWKQNNSTDSYLRHGATPTISVPQTLQRRHSTHQTHPDPNDQSTEKVMECDKMLISRADGVDVAFERTKAWSTYSKDVISYVRARIQLEQDHARKVHTLVDTSRRDINKPFMPLREIFDNSFDTEVEMVAHTKETTEHLRDRVVEALDARRKEHDSVRNALKLEWSKATKSLHDCEEAYEKSKISLRMREEALKKARESCLRTESLPPEREASRRRRDLEKKNRAVEEAIMKKEEAERQVMTITADLRKKRKDIDKTKESIIERLRELIFQCEQTTKACTVHYFTSLAALWARLPGAFHELSNATRDYQPGTEYMAFLQTLPTRAASSSSLVRSDRSIDEGVASCDGSSSLTSLRRNAINPDDEGALPDTKRHKKTSYAGRTFDNHEISTAAQSHHIQRTVQPSKCSACDTLSILYTVQCIDCGGQWHKACFPRIQQVCGQASKMVDRRTSIFGVPLKGLLEHQNRHVPLIIEKSVDQLQKRGLRAKGIYRTCGVKSKIEEICNSFERCSSDDEVCLDNENPMNLASVIKLYLRKLPEPLLTYELYDDFVRLGTESCSAMASGSNCEEEQVEQVRNLIRKLPTHNYETLKFIMIHLNRVSWFHEVNLMGASNLSTVIAPSLIWMSPKRIDHNAAITHAQYTNKAVEVMIRNAYSIFGMDRQTDWQSFFSRYSVEEPPKEEEDDCGNESDIEDDIEDDLDDQDRSDDDDEEIFLPPTPDILKTTRKPVEQTTSLPNPKYRYLVMTKTRGKKVETVKVERTENEDKENSQPPANDDDASLSELSDLEGVDGHVPWIAPEFEESSDEELFPPTKKTRHSRDDENVQKFHHVERKEPAPSPSSSSTRLASVPINAVNSDKMPRYLQRATAFTLQKGSIVENREKKEESVIHGRWNPVGFAKNNLYDSKRCVPRSRSDCEENLKKLDKNLREVDYYYFLEQASRFGATDDNNMEETCLAMAFMSVMVNKSVKKASTGSNPAAESSIGITNNLGFSIDAGKESEKELNLPSRRSLLISRIVKPTVASDWTSTYFDRDCRKFFRFVFEKISNKDKYFVSYASSDGTSSYIYLGDEFFEEVADFAIRAFQQTTSETLRTRTIRIATESFTNFQDRFRKRHRRANLMDPSIVAMKLKRKMAESSGEVNCRPLY